VAMLSLRNAFSDEEVADFDRRAHERLDTTADIDYMAEPKLDGLAVTLSYEHGRLNARCDARRRRDRGRRHGERAHHPFGAARFAR